MTNEQARDELIAAAQALPGWDRFLDWAEEHARFVDECGAYLNRARRAVTVEQVAERGAYHSSARVGRKHLPHLEFLLRIEFPERSAQKMYLIAEREQHEEWAREIKRRYWDAKRRQRAQRG
jgi:hypothetical protein